MEESGGLQLESASFGANYPLTSYVNGRLENAGVSKVLQYFDKEKPSSSTCRRQLEMPESPHQAMEFLSRLWSPSASDFFHILSTNCPLSPNNDNDCLQGADEVGKEETRNNNGVTRADNTWNTLSNGRSSKSTFRKYLQLGKRWMNIGYLKHFVWWNVRKKEEDRLQTSQVHAAVSMTQLATAIAGCVAMGCLEHYEDSSSNYHSFSSGVGSCDNKMRRAVGSAAFLVATACAELSESVGAERVHVTSAIEYGLAARTSTDVLALTATAATCLRGATLLNSRANASKYGSWDQDMIAKGAHLWTRTSNGKVQVSMVRIYLKNNKLILRLEKKYLKGAITTFKEYRVSNAMEEIKGELGFYLLSISTSEGIVKLMFEDEEQCRIWISIISQLLTDRNTCSII